MKSFLYNSGLTAVLVSFLALPILGFGFIGKSVQNEKPEVLSAVSHAKVLKSQPVLVDQIDLEINLSDRSIQRFYNIIPEKYDDDNYAVAVVIPKELRDSGLSYDLIKTDFSYDLELVLAGGDLYFSSFNATILIFE